MLKKQRKISVLIATGIYPPQIGGPATYSKLLEDELPKKGIEIKILSFGRIKFFPKILRHIVYFFLLLIKGFKADIIYALDPVSTGFPSFLASNILNKPFVLRVAGDYAWEQGTSRFGVTDSLDLFSEKSDGYGNFVRFLKFIQKRTALGADLVIVPSEYLKRIVLNWGIESENIQVIYNAFDTPENIASKKVIRQMMNISGKVIVSVGRLVPWKGFDTLIKVMRRVVESEKDAKLLVIGSGIDENRLQNIIKEENAGDYVTLVGRLDHETLMSYLHASDLFVLNTNYEGFSHQLLECMALELPIVTTSVGGNTEIIEHNVNGLLVPFNNEKELERMILVLLRDAEKKNKLVENAKKRVQDFGTDKMIDTISSVLKSV